MIARARRLIRHALGIFSPSLAALGREPDLTLARKAAARGDFGAMAAVISADSVAGFYEGLAAGGVDIFAPTDERATAPALTREAIEAVGTKTGFAPWGNDGKGRA